MNHTGSGSDDYGRNKIEAPLGDVCSYRSNLSVLRAGLPTPRLFLLARPRGGISVYNTGPGDTDLVIDMNGYFAL